MNFQITLFILIIVNLRDIYSIRSSMKKVLSIFCNQNLSKLKVVFEMVINFITNVENDPHHYPNNIARA